MFYLDSPPDPLSATAPPVSESQMELLMHPRTEGGQRCLSFLLSVEPARACIHIAIISATTVHHFDVPVKASGAEDRSRSTGGSWIHRITFRIVWRPRHGTIWMLKVGAGDYWEMLMPSQFARPDGHAFRS